MLEMFHRYKQLLLVSVRPVAAATLTPFYWHTTQLSLHSHLHPVVLTHTRRRRRRFQNVVLRFLIACVRVCACARLLTTTKRPEETWGNELVCTGVLCWTCSTAVAQQLLWQMSADFPWAYVSVYTNDTNDSCTQRHKRLVTSPFIHLKVGISSEIRLGLAYKVVSCN